MRILRIGKSLDSILPEVIFNMLKEAVSNDGKLSRKYQKLLRSGSTVLSDDLRDSGLADVSSSKDGLKLTELGREITRYSAYEYLPEHLKEKFVYERKPLAFPHSFAKRVGELTRAAEES